MSLEEIVTSLELSKKLRDVCLKIKESCIVWIYVKKTSTWRVVTRGIGEALDVAGGLDAVLGAYTVTELMNWWHETYPKDYVWVGVGDSEHGKYHAMSNAIILITRCKLIPELYDKDKATNALAKLILWLLEQEDK